MPTARTRHNITVARFGDARPTAATQFSGATSRRADASAEDASSRKSCLTCPVGTRPGLPIRRPRRDPRHGVGDPSRRVDRSPVRGYQLLWDNVSGTLRNADPDPAAESGAVASANSAPPRAPSTPSPVRSPPTSVAEPRQPGRPRATDRVPSADLDAPLLHRRVPLPNSCQCRILQLIPFAPAPRPSAPITSFQRPSQR